MNIVFDTTFLFNVWLVFCRIGTFLLLNPVFSAAQVPVRIRILFVLALSVCFAMAVANKSAVVLVPDAITLTLMMLGELVIGAVMAFGVFAAFGAFLLGGRIIDFQMGFGVANLVDPTTNQQAPLLGTMLNLVAVISFFLVDGHLLLLESIGYSLEMRPLGKALAPVALEAMMDQFGLMFIFGIAMVAPVIITLLLLDVSMAIAARTMPQVNMFIVSLPLKILVGLLVVALSLPLMRDVFGRVYSSLFVYLDKILAV